jgi:hypothetical protein
LKGASRSLGASNASNGGIPKAHAGGVIGARNAQETMHRKTVLGRGYHTQTAENNTARGSAKNVPYIKYTSKAFKIGESYYTYRRKACG